MVGRRRWLVGHVCVRDGRPPEGLAGQAGSVPDGYVWGFLLRAYLRWLCADLRAQMRITANGRAGQASQFSPLPIVYSAELLQGAARPNVCVTSDANCYGTQAVSWHWLRSCSM